MGLEVLDCWADRGPLPNGLFRCPLLFPSVPVPAQPHTKSRKPRLPEENTVFMTLHFPEEEGPAVYCARDSYEEETYRESCRLSNDKVTLHAFLIQGII